MTLCILGVLSVTPMIYMGKFNPLEFFDSSISKGATELSKLKVKAPKNLSSVVTDQKVQVYKWRDENGIMQFSNTPPQNANSAESIVLDTDHNVIQAVKVPKQEPMPVQEAQPSAEMPKPYSVKGMKKVMDDARGIEDMLKQSNAQRQKMLNTR